MLQQHYTQYDKLRALYGTEMTKFKTLKAAILPSIAIVATPALAQDSTETEQAEQSEEQEVPTLEGSALDGDYLAVGLGIGYGPGYIGSDDYTVLPIPLLQGSVGGVDINPRPAGFALDFINDGDERVSFQFGPEVKLNFNRAVKVSDDVVDAFPDLDVAVEVGPTIGINIDRLITPVDSLNINADILFDVAGAHGGMSVRPTVTYFTPLSRGSAITLSGHATWVDDDYADYYFSVDPTLSPGTPLTAFQAEGGFQDTGVTALAFFDLNGDLLDGGIAVFGIANYTRVLGDAADSPFTSQVGSADQFFGGIGVGYVF